MQEDSESFEHFMTELQLLVKDCGYPNTDEMVRTYKFTACVRKAT